MFLFRLIAVWFCVLALVSVASEEPKPDLQTIRAMDLLRSECLSCHGPKKNKSRLRLDSREHALKGGREHGPAFRPDAPLESPAVRFLAPDSDPHMPPKKQLTQKQRSLLANWITQGAQYDTERLLRDPLPSPEIHQLQALPLDYAPVLCLAVSPDGSSLAAGRGSAILLHLLTAPDQSYELRAHTDVVQSIVWAPSGTWLASGGFRTVKIWDVKARMVLQEFNRFKGRINAMAVAPDEERLYVAHGRTGEPGVITCWKKGSDQPESEWTAHEDTVFRLAIPGRQSRLFSAGADGLVKVWDTETFVLAKTMEAHNGHVMSIDFNTKLTRFATAGADRDLKIWDMDTLESKLTIRRHPGSVTDIAWSNDDQHLVSVCEDGAPRWCEESNTSPRKTFANAAGMLHAVDLSTDGKTVYGGCQDGLVYAWNLEGKILARIGNDPSP